MFYLFHKCIVKGLHKNNYKMEQMKKQIKSNLSGKEFVSNCIFILSIKTMNTNFTKNYI